MIERGVVAGVLLLAMMAPLGAQETGSDPQPHFLDRPELRNTIPYRDLVFEGQILRHIIFYSPLAAVDTIVMSPPENGRRPTRTAWSVTFTPLVRLRMIGETSSPVRPPSFMPKFTVQYFRFRRRSDASRVSEYARGPVDLWSADLTLGHHSNGQEGCLWDASLPDGDPACTRPPGRLTSSDLNQQNGSWSTNYLRGGLRFKRMETDDERVVDRELGGGLWVEVHPHLDGNPVGSISSELQDLYGWGVVGAEVRWMRRDQEHHRARTRIEASLERVLGADSPAPDWIWSLEASRSFEWLRGWGIFARWYRGRDYYNVQFLEELNELQLGLVFDGGPLSVFSEPSDPGF